MAMAAEASGITAIARPVSRAPEHILQVLDRGVMGVQVPHVNTGADARRVLEAVKYHPLGSRSLAAGTRAAVYDSHGTLADYVAAANNETLVAVQLEDREAIDNIDELLKVDNIDVFFIGPSDLSQSMGHPGNPKAPAVAEAIDSSFRKMIAAGRTRERRPPRTICGACSTRVCAISTPIFPACFHPVQRATSAMRALKRFLLVFSLLPTLVVAQGIPRKRSRSSFRRNRAAASTLLGAASGAELGKMFDQQFVIENVGGGGGSIACQQTARGARRLHADGRVRRHACDESGRTQGAL